jgi:Protein of unknown function (DUF1501)
MTSENSNEPNRREMLWRTGGLGGIALAWLLGEQGALADGKQAGKGRPEFNGGLHHRASAKRVIQLFMSGAASQCDTFDYKPLLIKKHGGKFDPGGKIELFQSSPGSVMASPWAWKQHGQSGRWISDLLPELATCADEMAFLYAMVSKSNVHGPATFMQNTGFTLPGFPSAGAWISYGLGALTSDLPAFVVLPDSRGVPPNGPANWGSGFLPASTQGTAIKVGSAQPIHDLFPATAAEVTQQSERDGLELLSQLNTHHRDIHPADSRLNARIQSYEMAAKMQLSAPDVLNTQGESKAVRDLYGVGDPIRGEFGERCLIARRLLERGVRFVQIWSGADNGFPRRNWDSHEDLAKDHYDMGTSMDRGAAALIKDLKSRGMLDDTIIIWTTEFGRMPCSQGGKGRDHNPFAFTSWLAGGGIKGGASYGESDEWSYKPAVNPTYCYDLHATVLHLLGIDHKRLTYPHDGINRRLTDVHGEVIREIIKA